MPADFLDEIDLAQEIDTKGWRDDIPAICHCRHGQAEIPQNSINLGIRNRRAEQRREPVPAHVQLQRFAHGGIDVDDRPAQPARADLFQQSPRSAGAPRQAALMSAPRSNLDDASVLSPRVLLVRRTEAGLEMRALERNERRRLGYLGKRPSHHPGDGLRSIAIGDHQHVGIEFPVDTVECRNRLVPIGAPDMYLGASKRFPGRRHASGARARSARSS